MSRSGLNKSERLSTKKVDVESWQLVYMYIVRDFKIQRHISNKNNYCLKSEFLFFQSYNYNYMLTAISLRRVAKIVSKSNDLDAEKNLKWLSLSMRHDMHTINNLDF